VLAFVSELGRAHQHALLELGLGEVGELSDAVQRLALKEGR
jgi:hypothetical protein